MRILKFVSLLLAILLFITGCSENNKEKQTTFEETSLVTTELTTTQEVIEEQNQTSETLTGKPLEKLFAEDMIASFDNYKPCEYEDDKCIIKAKIPDSWSYELYPGWDGNLKRNASPDCGLNLYKNDTNIISVIRFKASHNYQIEDYESQENFTTVFGLKGIIAYDIFSNNEKLQGFIQLEDSPLILIFLKDIDTKYFEENKQELFNVLNSIEITKLEENN